MGVSRIAVRNVRSSRWDSASLHQNERGAEPAEYVLVAGLVVVPLTVAVWMLVLILFRYYSIGVGVVDLPFF